MEILRVEELTVKRGSRKVLDGVNFSLSSGEKVIIAGDNGAGKTTLIEALMGFVPIEKGKIYLRGKEVRSEEDFFRLRTTVGYVFQNPDDQLFSLTVEEELAFAPLNLRVDREEVKRRIDRVLRLFSIEHLRERTVYSLSGGEKRILSIACVLTMNPEALILDEPTTGLDRKRFNRLLDFLKSTEKSVVVVTHDSELIKSLRWKVYRLEEGKLFPSF
ncbi:energy-coupling factor ABC transporter ATP-binding protein [Phorcysia thermohydrogeniphila]|uniref:Cobalt/nickel transport system ATP-binding protein n=1 Tax=Phorcysia thermohydrogeniphila TaxID=936138 RepID=A0A4R1GK53_9BACT|nr:ABC transporter ATP-binding protein [Phorcysia thermohydrogeniphila]TCK04662.1 cobalt/nickel transport system ATP-binding protein [Phorcysia thermohydrogeniphila]